MVIEHLEPIEIASSLWIIEHGYFPDLSASVNFDGLELVVLSSPFGLKEVALESVCEAKLHACYRVVSIVALESNLVELDLSVSWELQELFFGWPLTINW